MTGTPQQKHLERIEDDQSLNGIDTIDDTVRNDAGRKWFVSQAVTPVVHIGTYDEATGRIYLNGGGASPNWRESMVPNSAWTTTSAAALTLTCATGHRYRVYYAGARNATQATLNILSGTIGGNAWTEFQGGAGGGILATDTIVSIGDGGNAIDAVAGSWAKPSVREIWLNAGDTLTQTLTVYAAGNNTEHLFLFEDYTL